MKNNCDILNLEWKSDCRDVDIVEPILAFLEIKYGLKVVRDSIWYGELKIIKYKPKILLLANSVGADINARIIKFASRLGIKTVALISEGDAFNSPLLTTENFWGWNEDAICYEDLTLLWCKKNKDIFTKIKGTEKFNFQVSGATGFDRYKFLNFMSKDQLLIKYNKKEFSKVIGISVYPFDYYEGSGVFLGQTVVVVEELCKKMLKHRTALQSIYKKLIEANPDILFVLKLHPAQSNKELSDCAGLFNRPNVLEIFIQENIASVINSCDLWIAFESTSGMEAWLLEKTTIYLNPLNRDFDSSKIFEGTAKAKTYFDLQAMIDEFYQTGKVKCFDELQDVREKICTDIIGYADGNNHVRASEYIMDLFEKESAYSINVDKFVYKCVLKELIRVIFMFTPLRYLSKKRYEDFKSLSDRYKKRERDDIVEKYKNGLYEFHNLLNGKIKGN